MNNNDEIIEIKIENYDSVYDYQNAVFEKLIKEIKEINKQEKK